jgi:hypothetical protein
MSLRDYIFCGRGRDSKDSAGNPVQQNGSRNRGQAEILGGGEELSAWATAFKTLHGYFDRWCARAWAFRNVDHDAQKPAVRGPHASAPYPLGHYQIHTVHDAQRSSPSFQLVEKTSHQENRAQKRSPQAELGG